MMVFLEKIKDLVTILQMLFEKKIQIISYKNCQFHCSGSFMRIASSFKVFENNSDQGSVDFDFFNKLAV